MKFVQFKFFLMLVWCLINSISWAQTSYSISGKVIDSETGEPLVFANLIFNEDNSLGTFTDTYGEFSFSTNQKLINLSCTYLGYEKENLLLKNENKIVIRMKKVSEKLSEVLIQTKENPAKKIIEKVILNKSKNDPKNIETFSYRSYSKTIFDLEPIIIKDSLEDFNKDHYIFLMEDISETKFKKPKIWEKTILASKVSGFSDISFPIIARELQPFSFYETNIKLLDEFYLNPISKLGLEKYNFKLEERIYQKNDTIYTISFHPVEKKNIEGLVGMVNVNSNRYAIQSIKAKPFEYDKVQFMVEQEYFFIQNHWFPKQLNYKLEFNSSSEEGIIYVDSKIFLDSIQLNIPLKRKDFSIKEISISPNATKRDNKFWEDNRMRNLTQKELKTYRIIDSIGEKHNFSKYISLIKKLPENKLQIGLFDLDLSQTFVFNKYEGIRLGTGIYTNENMFKRFVFGGFLGYGLKDKTWKYGAIAEYEFHSERGFLQLGYKNTFFEIGAYGINRQNNSLFDFRRFIAYRFDRVEEYDFKLKYKIFRNLNSKISLNKKHIEPKYNFEINNEISVPDAYNLNSINFTIEYGDLNDRINIGSFLEKNSTNSFNTSLFYEKGFSGLFKNDFIYNKLEANISQTIYFSGIGKTSYRFEIGFIDDILPYGQLFTGEGGLDKNYPFIMDHNFQTVYPYEFLSDRYMNMFFKHDFGSLLFKTNTFQPHIILHHNLGWGVLSKKNEEKQNVGFKTKENVFTEVGIELNRMLKINYLNVGYLNIGLAGFYRYGTYSYPQWKDNLKIKFTLDYTFK